MINVNLNEHGDRVVVLNVTDKHGGVYSISMEFVAHDYDVDDVQISCYKLPKNHAELMAKGSCPLFSPNSMLHNERTIVQAKPGQSIIPNVWFEFHPMGDLPAVQSIEVTSEGPWTTRHTRYGNPNEEAQDVRKLYDRTQR